MPVGNEEDEDSDEETMRILKKAALRDADSDDDDEEEEEGSEEEEVPKSKKGKDSTPKAATTPAKGKGKGKGKTPTPASDSDSGSEGEGGNIFERVKASASATAKGATLGDLQWDEVAPLGGKGKEGKKGKNGKEKAEAEAESSDESEEEEVGGKRKLRTRQKESVKRRAEKDLRTREAQLADGSLLPQNRDDFERLLIAQPNSSYLWVQFMAHLLQGADVAGARAVAARALRVVDYREEDEKYNVWVALLNMEQAYGSPDTQAAAFTRAVAESKGKRIHLAMANTHEMAGDMQLAEDMYCRALKRPQFKKSKKVWMAYHGFKLRTGEEGAARQQLTRSLQSLSRHKHVDVTKSFALSQFDNNLVDGGRALFEELLASYPKRTDLWHLYVDREVKLGNVVQSRAIFERMISAKSSGKNMRAAFKKYLGFEQRQGDAGRAEAVKAKAQAYVASVD